MGGFFGVSSSTDCVTDLFFGTDYHSHLGTQRGGMAVLNRDGFTRHIHDIRSTQFRAKFEDHLKDFRGNQGIGIISDTDDQPVLIRSHLGTFAIVTVGIVRNAEKLATRAFAQRSTHFSEIGGNALNPTEIVATLINEADNFADGIANAQARIEGSCSLLLLTDQGIYAARDRLGRTPIVIGRKHGSYAATMETCAFPNLDYEITRYLGPGEVVLLQEGSLQNITLPGPDLQICAFLWVYYGYPSSHFEDINVEQVRNHCGAALARRDHADVDLVAGIPDSGTSHALGYAAESGIPYRRPFVKYTPTWPRSFMPQDQSVRDLVARMKLTPIPELINDQRMLFCEDSIVRGTQLQETVQRLFSYGAREVHMRAACPPLVYGCPHLNFSRSRSDLDLATRKAIREIEGDNIDDINAYTHPGSDAYAAMVEHIRDRLQLTSLRFQLLDDLVSSIGLPKSKLCTYCWDGCNGCADPAAG